MKTLVIYGSHFNGKERGEQVIDDLIRRFLDNLDIPVHKNPTYQIEEGVIGYKNPVPCNNNLEEVTHEEQADSDLEIVTATTLYKPDLMIDLHFQPIDYPGLVAEIVVPEDIGEQIYTLEKIERNDSLNNNHRTISLVQLGNGLYREKKSIMRELKLPHFFLNTMMPAENEDREQIVGYSADVVVELHKIYQEKLSHKEQ